MAAAAAAGAAVKDSGSGTCFFSLTSRSNSGSEATAVAWVLSSLGDEYAAEGALGVSSTCEHEKKKG